MRFINLPRLKLILVIVLPFIITTLLTVPALFGAVYKQLEQRSEAYAEELAYGLNLEIALQLGQRAGVLEVLSDIAIQHTDSRNIEPLLQKVAKEHVDVKKVWVSHDSKAENESISFSKVTSDDGKEMIILRKGIAGGAGVVNMSINGAAVKCLLDDMLNYGMKSSALLTSGGEVLFSSGGRYQSDDEIKAMLESIALNGKHTVKYNSQPFGGLVYEVNTPLYIKGINDPLITSNVYLVDIALDELTSNLVGVAIWMVICSIISVSIALVIARNWMRLKHIHK